MARAKDRAKLLERLDENDAWMDAVAERVALAATDPGYKEAARIGSEMLGAECERIWDFQGVNLAFRYWVRGEDVASRLDALRPRLERLRCWAFRLEINFQREDEVALVPTDNRYEALALVGTGTHGSEFRGVVPTTRELAGWLMDLHRREPFDLLGVGDDFLEGRFTSSVRDARSLATELYQLAPETHFYGVKTFEQEIRAGRFFVWWD